MEASKYNKENLLWEQPQVWRETLLWTSQWEKWYEHYSSLSASAIPVIKWEGQEELTIYASKDLLTCGWDRRTPKLMTLQDQSVLITCMCRKVLIMAHSRKQLWVTLPKADYSCDFAFPHLHPRIKKSSTFLYSASCSFAPSPASRLCWVISSTGNPKATFVSPHHPVAYRRARFWLTGCSAWALVKQRGCAK